MARPLRITITYSGSTGYDLEVGALVDCLTTDMPTDEQIRDAMRADMKAWLDAGDPAPPVMYLDYDFDAVAAAIRLEIERRPREP